MDRGELFKHQFTVEPVNSGGFVVTSSTSDVGYMGERYAFTSLDDLMAWLNEQRQPLRNPVSDPSFTIGTMGGASPDPRDPNIYPTSVTFPFAGGGQANNAFPEAT